MPVSAVVFTLHKDAPSKKRRKRQSTAINTSIDRSGVEASVFSITSSLCSLNSESPVVEPRPMYIRMCCMYIHTCIDNKSILEFIPSTTIYQRMNMFCLCADGLSPLAYVSTYIVLHCLQLVCVHLRTYVPYVHTVCTVCLYLCLPLKDICDYSM